ncbi:MAG: hypothetical protein EDM05_61715 [Leptolyngbya sp. IPPAS B-1204]
MTENSHVQRRKRGVILSPQGWQRLQLAEQQAAELNNAGKAYTLEQLGEQTGLSPNTITKVRRRRLAVDRQTLEFYFNALKLTLHSDDYISMDTDVVTGLQMKPIRGTCRSTHQFTWSGLRLNLWPTRKFFSQVR